MEQRPPPVLEKAIREYPDSDLVDFNVVMYFDTAKPANREPPETLSACPDPAYADHILTEITAFDQAGKYQRRVYEKLPATPVVSSKYDSVSGTFVNQTKTRKLVSEITEGVENGTDNICVTEIEGSNGLIANEVVTCYPLPEYDSEENAKLSETSLPFKFDATLDVYPWSITAGGFGYVAPFVRRIPHLKKEWWVYAEEKPALSLNGIVEPGVIYRLNGREVGEVIYDAFDAFDSSISETVEYPGSDPDFTTYMASWVGGAMRSILGSVEQDGSKFRWKIEKVFIQFRTPILPPVPDLPPP
jgi:hypothetical protein